MQQTLQTGANTASHLSDQNSPSAEEIAAFIDGRLDEDARARVEAYLADNPDARSELLDVAKILETVPAPRRDATRIGYLVAIAAAAVFAIVMLKPNGLNRVPST